MASCSRLRRGVSSPPFPPSWRARSPTGLDLLVLQPPIDVPAPEIQKYWHSRHDRNPAHRWMRQKVLEAVQAL
jgi:DNA-binding transcriptional LysR family regulator